MTDNTPAEDEDLFDGKPQKDEDTLWDTVKTIGYAVLFAFLIRSFVYEPFSIPSGSMIPTLLVGDYLFVSKMSYGYSKHSLPMSLPILPERVMFSEPERGDVAVFKTPTDNSTDYIKRIVGLPGDTIQVKRGILHINGKAVKRERLGEFVYEDVYGSFQHTVRYLETLPNGVQHEILEESDRGPLDNTMVFRVPEGHYFGMGDNRDHSQDSRVIGYIPKENLVGRADVKFFSIDGSFWKFWQWPWSLRFDRFFKAVD